MVVVFTGGNHDLKCPVTLIPRIPILHKIFIKESLTDKVLGIITLSAVHDPSGVTDDLGTLELISIIDMPAPASDGRPYAKTDNDIAKCFHGCSSLYVFTF
jgi:hypothetical protein